MRNALQKQTQDVRSSFNFEFALNGPAKKIHNKKQLLFQPERKKNVNKLK